MDLHSSESPVILLQSALAVLRSRDLSDRATRVEAERIISDGLLHLTSDARRHRAGTDDGGVEPVASAFAALGDELKTLARHNVLAFDLVPPPTGGRALPGPVASAARDIVRMLVLISIESGHVDRVRIVWDCDGTSLLMEFRDNGPGKRSRSDDTYRRVAEKVEGVGGSWSMDSAEGWGSLFTFELPLEDNTQTPQAPGELTDMQQKVLALLADGLTNPEIGSRLHLSVNTVKYHVSRLMKKYGATRRTELAVLAR